MSRRRPQPTLPADQLAIAWQSLSLLLDYPDKHLVARLPWLRSVSHELPAAVQPLPDLLRARRHP